MTTSTVRAIWLDLKANARGGQGPAALVITALFDRGFHLMLSYRLQRLCLRLPVIGIIPAKVLWYVTACVTACDICYWAKLDGGIYIPHATGIVIGDKVVIGQGTTILQHVTIGKKANGPSTERQVIGAGVYLGAGAKIIGDISIGNDAVVGANAVLLTSIPAMAVAVGIPAKVLKAKTA